MSLREEWRDYILATNAWRHLYLRKGMALDAIGESEILSTHEIQNFLDRLTHQTSDRRLLLEVHLLLSTRLQAFVNDILRDLLRAMARSTARERVVSRSGIRGHVDWPSTVSLRLAGRGDGGTFVVSRPQAFSDLPENRLVKLLLHEVASATDRVSAQLGTASTPAVITDLGVSCREALRNQALRDVTLVRRADVLMRQRSYRNRDWRFGEAAALLEELSRIVEAERWESIFHLLNLGWIAPIGDDDLFEVFALVLTLETLIRNWGYAADQIGLIKRGRRQVAVLRRAELDDTIDVFFDHSPTQALGVKSRYMDVVASYEGVEGSSRRPDLLLIRNKGLPSEHRVLVEVKKSTDGQYRRDSVYKVFAYLHDYADLWHGIAAHEPKAILLFPEAVSKKTIIPEVPSIALVDCRDTGRFSSLLETSLALGPPLA